MTDWTWRALRPLAWRPREDGSNLLHDPMRDSWVGTKPWTRALFEAIDDKATPEALVQRAMSHPGAPEARRVKRFLLSLEKVGYLAIDVPLPERLGALEVERELGRGGAGIAYLCRDAGERVVAKVPWGFLHSEELAIRAIHAEADVLAKLDHPDVVRLIRLQPGPVLVRELIDGADLVRVHEGRPATAAEAHRLAAAMGSIMEHVEARGLVLVDYKASNFFLTHEGRLRLIDAGHAKPPGALRVGGTPGFLPPEARTEPTSRAWDVWGLGRLYAYLRTGVLPALRSKDERPLDGVPDDARAFVAALCAEDPAARPATIRDALALLPAHAR